MDKHGLPGSSIDELLRIVKGYASIGKSASLDDLSKSVAMDTTVISRSNAFLKDFGIIDGGKQKQITEAGGNLSHALEHNQTDVVRNLLAELISQDEFMSKVVTAVRLKQGMDEDQLISHILYSFGQKDAPIAKTGARTVVELLTMGGFLSSENGTYYVPASDAKHDESDIAITKNVEAANVAMDLPVKSESDPSDADSENGMPVSVAVNIQLQLPESDDPKVFKELFKALRKYLINGEE